MENVTDNELFIVTPGQLKDIKSSLNMTEESIKNDVELLINWFKQQPHLPQHEIDPGWVERLLILNKNSLERTKQKMDGTFSSKIFYPDFFKNVDPLVLTIKPVQWIQLIPLPKLHIDNSRVIVMKPMNNISELYDFSMCIKYSFMSTMFRTRHDYYLSERIVYDMKGLSLSNILKTNPIELNKCNVAIKAKLPSLLLAQADAVISAAKVLGLRISGVHIINTNSLFDKLLMLVKASLGEKLTKRITAHHSMEDLHKHISPKILPKDYGGEERSCDELSASWNELLREKKNLMWFEEFNKLQSDESKRPTTSDNGQGFGVNGSFRKMNLD